jgi:hypothetical protein
MTVRDILGYICIPLVLFIVGGVLRGFGFNIGERNPFYNIGELAMLTAIAMLILGASCLACQLPAGELPVLGVLLIILVSIAVAATGLFFDIVGMDLNGGGGGAPLWGPGGRQLTEAYYVNQLKTLFQFAMILVGAFIVPRMARKPYAPEPDTHPTHSRYERD